MIARFTEVMNRPAQIELCRAVSWTQTRDLHAEAWSSRGGDVSIYYQLRKSVMDGMLSGSGLQLSMSDLSHYTI